MSGQSAAARARLTSQSARGSVNGEAGPHRSKPVFCFYSHTMASSVVRFGREGPAVGGRGLSRANYRAVHGGRMETVL